MSITITGWVKFSISQDNFAGIVVKGPQKTNYPGFQLYIANGGYPAFEVTTSNLNGYKDFIRCTSSLSIQDDKWHFISGVVHAVNKSISLYVDGVEVARQTTPGDLYPGYKNSEPILIGIERNKTISFSGYIDDVQIYKSAMTQSQIMVLYNR
ncbi:MAG: LamG domain-containing protein [Armatimonadetes bacterium]|nr:LamG domain-containing protein [Armatimonadota bacterium]